MPFKILVDTAQWRMVEPGVSTLASGPDWDMAFSSADVFLESATDTLMCRPGCEYPAWQTSNAGIYAKLSRADFTTTPNAGDPGWPAVDPVINTGDGSWIFYPNNTLGVKGILNFALVTNQAIVAEWFVPPQTPADSVGLEIGVNSAITGANGVSFRFYNGGKAEVYKDGNKQGEYTMSGEKKHYRNRNKAAKGAAPSAEYVRVCIIPCRGREVLVFSSAGTGFSHVFDDIPEGTVSPVITTNDPLWFKIPAGFSVNHRFALCKFSAGGSAYSALSKFRVDPGPAPAGGFQSWVLGETAGGTITLSAADAVGGGAYVNNTNGVRVKAVLAGAGGLTPFVFGARVYTLPVTAQTVDSPTDVTKYLVPGGSMDSTDSNSGLTGTLTFRNAPEIEEVLGATAFSVLGHRPCQLWDDDGELWVDGLLMPPETECAVVFTEDGLTTYDRDGWNGTETITFALRDRMQLADDFEYYDDTPRDGMTLQNAFIADAKDIGFQPGEIHVSDFGGFTLPAAGAVTDREFNVMAKAGDRGSQRLKSLHEDFASNAFFGLDPANGLQLTSIDDAPTAEVGSLYDCFETMDEHGVERDPRLLIRSMKVVIVSPEANDIFAVGMDYRTRRPIVAHKRDAGSADPTVAVGARAFNWMGTLLGYSFGSDQLATEDAVVWACGLLFDRLTPIRALVEVTCDSKAKYRRGQPLKVELMSSGMPRILTLLASAPGIGGLGIDGTTVKGRIKSWHAALEHLAVPDDDGIAFAPWRPGRYVLQVLDGVSDAANMHVHSTTAAGVREEVRARMIHRRRTFSEPFKGVLSRELIGHSEV